MIGLTIKEYMANCRANVNGRVVEYESVKYFAQEVREDGMVELYATIRDDQPCFIVQTDLVTFVE